MRTLGPATRVLISLFLIALSTGCHATNSWVMNNSGRGFYERGNYAAAKQEFACAVADNPFQPDYRHNLAMAMQKQGDLSSSEQVLRHNLSIDPSHQPTYHALAQTLVMQHRSGEAQELLAEWVATQPYTTQSYVELAWLNREIGDPVTAEQTLRRALQLEPNNPVVLAHLGQIQQESGDVNQASNFYTRSLTSQWDQPEVKSRLATLTNRRDLRRSALLHNRDAAESSRMAQEPMILNPMFMASSEPSLRPTIDATSFEDTNDVSRRNGRHRRRSANEKLVAYPLPDYGSGLASSFTASNMFSGSVLSNDSPVSAEQGTIFSHANQTAELMVPDSTIVTQEGHSSPMATSGPVLMPQMDPAHATEHTARIPTVDPH